MTGLSVPKRDLGIVIVASVVNKTLKNFKGELNDNKAVINIGNFLRELQDTANGFSSRYHKEEGSEPVITKEELISIVTGSEFSLFFELVNDKEVIIRAKPREYETALKKLVLDSTMRYSEALINQINAMGREYREVKENQRETQKKQSEELKSEKNNEEEDEDVGETRDVENTEDVEEKIIEGDGADKDEVSVSEAAVELEDQTKIEEPEVEAADDMNIDEEEKSDSGDLDIEKPVDDEKAEESEEEQDKEEKIDIDEKKEVDVKEEDDEKKKGKHEDDNDESNEEHEKEENEEENEQEVDSEDNKENDGNDDSKQSSLEPSVESETPVPKSEPDLSRLFGRTTRSTPEPLGRKRSGSPYATSSSQHKRFQNIAVNLINSIQAHRYSSPFLQAVNKRDALDYYDVIYQPKNLKGILKAVKLKAKDPEYRLVKQLERDIMLMFANCVMYNKSDEDLVQLTISMKNDVNNIFKMFEEAELDIK